MQCALGSREGGVDRGLTCVSMSSRPCEADGGAGRGVWQVVATSLSLRAQNVSRVERSHMRRHAAKAR